MPKNQQTNHINLWYIYTLQMAVTTYTYKFAGKEEAAGFRGWYWSILQMEDGM